MSGTRSTGGVVWIPANTTFGEDDFLYYAGKGDRPFDEIAGRFDLIVTGPHATAAIPQELEGWIEPGITARKQHDFSDCTTSAVGRAWAAADPRVVYIENPHPRVLYDPNRPHPDDPEGDLREFFARLHAKERGNEVSFGGVDGLRPVTFAGERFLREPENEAEWNELVALLTDVAARGSQVYRSVRDELIERVYLAKAARLARVDLSTIGAAELNAMRMLTVQCIHDTMNATVTPDGAVRIVKPVDGRLPSIVSLGNRGDFRGEPRSPSDGSILPFVDIPTMSGAMLRATRRAFKRTFGVADDELGSALELNQPYLGAYEVQKIGRDLRALEARGIVRHESNEGLLGIRTAAYQAEFLRETLLGPVNVAHIQQPGTDWPPVDEDNVAGIVDRLVAAYEMLRRWDYRIEQTTEYTAPKFR
ncbi:MAG: N-formylglutamate amidohydrolase [Actinomycetota bacterium]|nr:N-formylglutamate amidohydrolase [Actinomycetota bacterium]